MAKHDVYLSAPDVTVNNKDVEFSIARNKKKLGTLKISKGSIEWVPANNIYGHHLDWSEFATLMEINGKK